MKRVEATNRQLRQRIKIHLMKDSLSESIPDLMDSIDRLSTKIDQMRSTGRGIISALDRRKKQLIDSFRWFHVSDIERVIEEASYIIYLQFRPNRSDVVLYLDKVAEKLTLQGFDSRFRFSKGHEIREKSNTPPEKAFAGNMKDVLLTSISSSRLMVSVEEFEVHLEHVMSDLRGGASVTVNSVKSALAGWMEVIGRIENNRERLSSCLYEVIKISSDAFRNSRMAYLRRHMWKSAIFTGGAIAAILFTIADAIYYG